MNFLKNTLLSGLAAIAGFSANAQGIFDNDMKRQEKNFIKHITGIPSDKIPMLKQQGLKQNSDQQKHYNFLGNRAVDYHHFVQSNNPKIASDTTGLKTVLKEKLNVSLMNVQFIGVPGNDKEVITILDVVDSLDNNNAIIEKRIYRTPVNEHIHYFDSDAVQQNFVENGKITFTFDVAKHGRPHPVFGQRHQLFSALTNEDTGEKNILDRNTNGDATAIKVMKLTGNAIAHNAEEFLMNRKFIDIQAAREEIIKQDKGYEETKIKFGQENLTLQILGKSMKNEML